ncbi:WXG100 family type VII secretion target [Actinoplanes sp. CA-030573]|uniref:WXG100 family type VII secretion target n=1 Tax=Actinoplanes sp. CA-030573 TaxID=3239898 RepID=UPI003D931CE8
MSGSSVVSGYQNVRDTAGAVLSPMGEAMNNGLDWLLTPIVWPLLQLFEQAVGDPDQLDHHAGTWNATARALRDVAAAQRADLDSLMGQWHGAAAEAYAARILGLARGLEDAAEEMAKTADSLGDSAMDLRNVEEMIKTIVRELVEWLVITWLAAQALAIVTAGASEAAAAAASAAETGIAVTRATRLLAQLHRALEAYKAFMEALKALGTMGKLAAWTLNKMFGPKHWIKMGIEATTGLDGSIFGETRQDATDLVMDAAADEYDDRRTGDDGDRSRFRDALSGVVDPIADRVP